MSCATPSDNYPSESWKKEPVVQYVYVLVENGVPIGGQYRSLEQAQDDGLRAVALSSDVFHDDYGSIDLPRWYMEEENEWVLDFGEREIHLYALEKVV